MFMAFRTTDSFHSGGKEIAIGGKAFVGVPIANNEEQRQLFREKGIVHILNQVCAPAVNKFLETIGADKQ